MSNKKPSRADRWSAAATACRTALDAMYSAASDLSDALQELRSVQEEYEDWKENLPEGLSQSAMGEKLEAVCALEIEGQDTEDLLSDLDTLISEAENADLPLGFGRD